MYIHIYASINIFTGIDVFVCVYISKLFVRIHVSTYFYVYIYSHICYVYI